jgi:hypothetical protein
MKRPVRSSEDGIARAWIKICWTTGVAQEFVNVETFLVFHVKIE